MTTPIWQPSAERIAASNMTAFRHYVEHESRVELPDYPSLYAWSIEHPEQFWASVWRFCGIRASRPWDKVLTEAQRMPGAQWFTGARLNFAENLLRYRDERAALVFWNENGRQRQLTYAGLCDQVAQLAAALRRAGVTVGDRIAGFLANTPETVTAMLAAASIGAAWSSCSPDFGAKAVIERFGQIEPKVLFATDGCLYNGRTIDTIDRVAEIAAQLPSVRHVVIVPYMDIDRPIDGIDRAVMLADFASGAAPGEIEFEQLPIDHPVYILYSSGTTGAPKCIVHGSGGTLIQHLKELVLHTDLSRDDRIFYFTTCGWMMWNWLVSSLAVGATVLLYDGSPLSRVGNILFDLAERERMTVFGTSARYLAAIEKEGIEPARTHDLSSLRTILSTGSPLSTDSFDYVYAKVKGAVCLSSISGGTDIVSCFALGSPISPVYRGELQVRGLGMNVKVYNENGEPVVGEKGELVCTAPFPSMPIGFWNDPDGAKYHEAYFSVYSGVWRHGDYAELTERGGMIIYGRADAVLNPGGVRIGTGEIYRPVQQVPEIHESLVVGQEWLGDVRVILFVKLRPGLTLDDSLVVHIKDVIRRDASPRHVPAKIIQVADIPRTISGKIVELAVREIIHGRPVKNREALANPESLAHFENLPELQS